jgi:hypothetical protein
MKANHRLTDLVGLRKLTLIHIFRTNRRGLRICGKAGVRQDSNDHRRFARERLKIE